MSGTPNNSNHSPNRIDTLIGAGMRVEGDIACAGVLRVQGEILGNVACDGSANGTLVIDSAGSVTGTIHATHVIVRGRVSGPLQATQSIEIHQGALVEGDICFKELAIHAGGVVKGLLKPIVATDAGNLAPEHQTPTSAEAATRESPLPHAARESLERLGGTRKVVVAAALAVVLVGGALLGRHLMVAPHSGDGVALKADASLQETPAPMAAPVGNGEPRSDAKAAAADAAPPAPNSPAETKDAAAQDHAEMDRRPVMTVRGANPSRLAGVFLLVSNEPSVLYRKKRDASGEGARIAVSQGERVSVSIATDELIRVAKGTDIVIFYQGQKVPANVIESGAWINFVPR